MRHQRLLQALRSLRKPKARPEVHGHCSNLKSPNKIPTYATLDSFSSSLGFDAITCPTEYVRPCAPEENVRKDNENQESQDLESETTEEDVICWSRVFSVTLCVTDECGANHLDGCGDYVASDKYA